MINKIDKKFFHNTDGIKAETVGELIDLLAELPRDLKTSGWPERESMFISVCNVSASNPHLFIDVD